ncbi:MAG: molecular chaperone Hsp20 [Flavobacteriaceae bacterium]|nr:molecular chaperone Hsp20 [Flavobacteriaceae bacterium]RCL67183.1 MAG: Hsp20/alpha crystallin family protein [Cryomorphaceae bacterium]|tara:strand:- start:46 stop:468 length:423 start_codon:yes stop_codon:yes gene_type:complete
MNLIKKQSSLFPLFFDQFFKNNWDINVPQNSFYNPSFNVKENDKEYVLEVIAPGKSNEDFQIEIENRLLSISTLNKKEQTDYNYNIKEFEFSSFEKSFELPYLIDTDKINSIYRNGILSITLPKRKEFQNVTKKIISVKK